MYIPKFKMINPDVGVYLFYAGKNRKFFKETKDRGALFLDLPGFSAGDLTFLNEAELAQQVHRSNATKKFIANPVENPRPLEATRYPTEIPRQGKRIDRAFLTQVVNSQILFKEVQKGDIVILTPGNHYDPVLLGEVNAPWDPTQHLSVAAFNDFQTPYRSVDWVQHDLARSDFAREVARHMQNRRAVTKLDPRFYQNIFKLIYPRYVWGEYSKIDVFSETYLSNDPTATYEASFLIKYAVALYVATEAGKIDEFLALDKEVAAEEYFDPELVDQMIQSFGSPGGYVGRYKKAACATFVAGVLAIALSSGMSTEDVANAVAIEFEAEAPKGSDIDHSHFGNALRAGSDDELREKYGEPAKKKLGLTLDGEVPPEIRSRELHK